MSETGSLGIAVVGLAGRFPQAPDIDAFWTLLKDGREAVVTFGDEELLAAGVDPALLSNPEYVKSGTVVDDIEYFDAGFFRMSTRDAEIADPQHRLFMECAWQALEHAGYPPERTESRVGLYAGVGENTYRRLHLEPNQALMSSVGAYRIATLNVADFLATYTAFKLNLTGPAVTVQTACSTSLVAVHMACQSLLNFECDMALAGGVSVFLPQRQGYLYQEGMIASPDGHCRAFDAQAQGTIHGGGAGVVLLKRLDEAIADGDTIHAVILGSAVNNDGASKIGFTAPGVGGQTDVILEAQSAAGVHPDEISYIESHGTATPLGDLIEMQALTAAFRAHTQRKSYCAIGSVKTNIGHADTAAGIAGLIKTILALQHRQLPASLHFSAPNPQIDFPDSPFFVNHRLRNWDAPGAQRRCAGVSAFGIGGTNAHLIVAEAPAARAVPQLAPAKPSWQLLSLSARTATALEKARRNLSDYLADRPDTDLNDVAYTLHFGRQDFRNRHVLVCRDSREAALLLSTPAPQGNISRAAPESAPGVVFLFPGGGAQYPNMGRDLYEANGIDGFSVYREQVDRCLAVFQSTFGIDLKPHLFPARDGNAEQTAQALQDAVIVLEKPSLAYPALFITEYSLAQLWLSWGIDPVAMIGHSMGEYVAACLAGVFSPEDALSIVTWRGQLYETLPPGAMLSVALSPADLQSRLSGDLAIAAINKQNLCTVSGPADAIARLAVSLTAEGIPSNRVRIAFAGHSPMQEPILDEFRSRLQRVRFSPPKIPFISNVSGGWIRPDEAVSPEYWVRHLRHTVRFADGVSELLRESSRVFLEVGPGQTLRPLIEAHPAKQKSHTVLCSMRHPADPTSDSPHLLRTAGELWRSGVAVDWRSLRAHRSGRRIPLPTYPFEREKHWIDAPRQDTRQTTQWLETTVTRQDAPVPQARIERRDLSPLEREIAAVWSQCLGTNEIDPEADFFALGGDSLLATQLAARLRDQLNVPLDTHSLLNAPTVAQLAAFIAAEGTHSGTQPALPELVVELQAGKADRKPLFLMHPVGGHVYSYRDLVRHLDPDLPVYGIRARGVEGEAEPLASVAEMARVYTAAVRATQPDGPYLLGGSSFGGVLAFAMAQELLAERKQVAFLALIDTPGPGNMPEPFEEIADILFYMLKVGQDMDVDIAALRSMDEARQLEFFLEHSRWRFSSPRDLKTMLTIFKTNERAMWDYVPETYPGKVHFYLARERDAFTPQTPAHGWIGLAGQGIEIHTVPGNHISMTEMPHVRHLAASLGQNLKESVNRFN